MWRGPVLEPFPAAAPPRRQLSICIVSGLHRSGLLGDFYNLPYSSVPHQYMLRQAAAEIREAKFDVGGDLGPGGGSAALADGIALLGPAELIVYAPCKAVDVDSQVVDVYRTRQPL